MSTITVEISGPAAEKLRRLVESEQRSEAEIVTDALESYTPRRRKLPTGIGKYRSGQSDIARNARAIIRQDVEEGRWP
jgi:hypothetical protein